MALKLKMHIGLGIHLLAILLVALPLPGSVKINWTVGRDGLSCGFFGRNSKGMFCVAGVYTSHDRTEIKSLIIRMLYDCTDWCRSKNVNSVYFETEDWRGVIWDGNNCSDIRIHNIQCAERVNCVAKCLVNICTGGSVMFLEKEGLPKGLGRILSLEGIPHFICSWGGFNMIMLWIWSGFQVWDPGGVVFCVCDVRG
nr:uncharacterized protein LOC109147873 [Ipomoea trifida]